jgi:hypothetical protein
VVSVGHPAQRLSAFGKQNGVPVLALDAALAERLCRATAQPG